MTVPGWDEAYAASAPAPWDIGRPQPAFVFEKADIEKVILHSADPGPIFDEKLRDAYDYIFESTENS